MRPCERCLENSWKYKVVEGYVIATCLLCGYEMDFPTKKLRKKLEYSQQRLKFNKNGE